MTCQLLLIAAFTLNAVAAPLDWPAITSETKPWAYHWWLGSAVDKDNLTRELTRYRDAGLGGVHIIPIYGAKGAESRYIEYLSPRWMEMLRHTVTEANRLGLGVDMTTGSGWCFGGPTVATNDANITTKDGVTTRLTMRVKRAAPGGEGWMINPFYADAMQRYLQRFTEAFAKYDGPKPRAMYHDSYEYNCNWSPNLPAEFEKHRGYKLPVAELFGAQENARLKADYRETISDMMVEQVWPTWVKWCRDHGFLTRNQAHGSPANILDLYALADIPETEMFHTDRDKFISKFASSAAHVTGKKLVAAETGTWLNEHFNETLAELKVLADDLFRSGVNHIIYHGCCYSPDEAPWPGWLFYASTEMNPRNAIWRDAPALNQYITRCQSVLQDGQPDNDVLLYWPIYDLWHDAKGLEQKLTVHKREWFHDQPISAVAKKLWGRGYSFDYISDRQLTTLTGKHTIVVPPNKHMPATTKRALETLAAAGCTVLYEGKLPDESLREPLVDIPGLQFIRRAVADGRYYFIANQGDKAVDAFVPLATQFVSVALMDPMTGRIGLGRHKNGAVRLQLAPGQSIIVRTFTTKIIIQPWPYEEPGKIAIHIKGPWQVKFIAGGPELPPPFRTDKLASWTAQGGEAERFAGTALYSTTFDAPVGKGTWLLDLGEVCHSARVRVNGNDCGTLIMPPYRVRVEQLKPTGNVLEVEVTNLSANRLRDLDRHKVQWRIFHDINFVNIHYKSFDASQWPIRPSGLLGPVVIREAK
ncbi:MAG: glycoside hydrolase [Verrucomicrobia bacterium]|nr:glycoside hydrolase [Verrucomicrobiota bacterium]